MGHQPNYIYPAPANFAYCHFAYPQGSGHSFGDSETIKACNGASTYYISWINGSGGHKGYWTSDGSSGYVASVCGQVPY